MKLLAINPISTGLFLPPYLYRGGGANLQPLFKNRLVSDRSEFFNLLVEAIFC